jgi:hypothetical protein
MLDQVLNFVKSQISGKGFAAILFYGSIFAIVTLLVTTLAPSALLFAGAFAVMKLLELYGVVPALLEWYQVLAIAWGLVIMYRVTFSRK